MENKQSIILGFEFLKPIVMVLSSGITLRIPLKTTDVSDKRGTSIFRVTEYDVQETNIKYVVSSAILCGKLRFMWENRKRLQDNSSVLTGSLIEQGKPTGVQGNSPESSYVLHAGFLLG